MTEALDIGRRRAPYRVKGWHVGAAVVAFFGVVISVDAAFVTMALRTYPGEVSKTPYEDGVAYNQRLTQEAAQAQLGWEATAEAKPGAVQVELLDRQGQPLAELSVTGRLSRPATEAEAQNLQLKATSPGIYVASVETDGAWDLTLKATDGQGQEFEARRRLTWP